MVKSIQNFGLILVDFEALYIARNIVTYVAGSKWVCALQSSDVGKG